MSLKKILWLVDISRKKVIKIGGDEHNDRKFDIVINRGFTIPDRPPIELVPLLLSDSVTTTAVKIFEALGRDAIITDNPIHVLYKMRNSGERKTMYQIGQKI